MSKIKLAYDLLGAVVTVALLNVVEVEGKDDEVTTLDSFEFDASQFPVSFSTSDEEVTKTLVGYGLMKLIQDRNSQVSGDAQKKFDAMKIEGQRLLDTGEWRAPVERQSGGATPKADPILAQAVAQLQGISIPVATAALSKLSKEELATLKSKAKVIEVMDELRKASKEAEAVDLGDLLA